jgi:hypothetical protein
MGSIESLERRIARIEAAEAIRRVQAKIAFASDDGYDPVLFGSLFTADAVWESNAFGTFTGRAAIEAFIRDVRKQGLISFAHHSMIPQWVDIAEDGHTAHGRWYAIQSATMPDAGGSDRAVIIACTYENDFAQVEGEWRYTKVSATFHFVSDWDKGWVEQPFRG